MSLLHPTITDKDRGPTPGVPGAIGLIEDGDWHWFSIRDDRDGQIKRAVVVPDGTYSLLVALGGKLLTVPPSDLEVSAVRYHLKPGPLPNVPPVGLANEIDRGEVGELYHDSTAWSRISLGRCVTSSWFDTFDAKIVVRAGSTDPTEAHAVGIDYRVDGGSMNRDALILKFLRQRDD